MSSPAVQQIPSRPVSVRLNDGEPMTSIFEPSFIAQFIRASFDGAINDESPFETVDDAVESISVALRQKYPTLTVRQVESAGLYIALEFNNRARR